MLILVLLGMYFYAVVVFVTSQTLLFRLALAILCLYKMVRQSCPAVRFFPRGTISFNSSLCFEDLALANMYSSALGCIRYS